VYSNNFSLKEKIYKTLNYLKDERSVMLHVTTSTHIKNIKNILENYKRDEQGKGSSSLDKPISSMEGQNYYIDAIFGLKNPVTYAYDKKQDLVVLLIKNEINSFKHLGHEGETWVATLSDKNMKDQIDDYFRTHENCLALELNGSQEVYDDSQIKKINNKYYSSWNEENMGDFLWINDYKNHKSWSKLMRIKSLAIEYEDYDTCTMADLIKKVNKISKEDKTGYDIKSNTRYRITHNYEDIDNCIYIPKYISNKLKICTHANDILGKHKVYWQITLDKKILADYLKCFFISELGQLSLEAYASGETVQSIPLKILNDMLIPVPGIQQQKKIIKISKEIEKTEEQIKIIKKNIAWQPKTETLYAESIEKITGIIKEVTQDDIYYDIINNGETKNIEFKSTFSMNLKNISQNKDKDVEKGSIKTLAGYLNTDGGELFIGISDDGQILGLEQEIEHFYKKKGLDGLKLHFMNQLNNLLGKSVVAAHIDINVHTFKEENKTILIAKCNKSEEGVFFDKSDFYIRQDPQTQKLEGKEMLDYIEQRKKSFNK
jgi:hypothetical protein